MGIGSILLSGPSLKKLSVALEYCYGIKSFRYTFDFAKGRAFAVYAPNGTMKSSLAQTFTDLSRGEPSKDRISPDKPTRREIVDERGKELPEDSVLVIPPYDPEYECEKTSTLLVNRELRIEYQGLSEQVDVSLETLFAALAKQAKTKRDIGAELASAFPDSESSPLLALLQERVNVMSLREAPFANLEYDKVFDERFVAFLHTADFQTALQDYITKYNELLEKSVFFKKGTFTYFDGSTVAKNLGEHGFFKAGHTVRLNGAEPVEIKDTKQFDELIAKEKDVILADPQLKAKFAEIEKQIHKNKELRSFQAHLAANPDVLELLSNLDEARKKVWRSYLKVHFELLEIVVDTYRRTEQRRKEIETEANRQRTQWEAVLEIFNARFSVPFKLSATNRASVVLGDPVLALSFTFFDSDGEVEVEKSDLIEALSQGERKALYILNVIFEIEARKADRQETLVVVDDIADSFDYKNKYAIVQYLKDIYEVPFFKMLLLTHNFDFFRTLESRFVPYKQCLMVVKTATRVTLEPADGIRNIFVRSWKGGFFNDPKKRVASIPFIRNIIEYTKGDTSSDYLKLTSLLHWKADTQLMTQGELDAIYKTEFSASDSWPNPTETVVDMIFDEANKCLTAPEGINFENKVVLAIAIRLAAEHFMVSELDKIGVTVVSDANQTQDLVKAFVEALPKETTKIAKLQDVALMTPENIHLNSFMYEPILDMSDKHLRDLFQAVLALFP